MPRSKNVSCEGLDIVEKKALLLKKVEELTLYAIDQNKKIEMLQSEVKALKRRIKKK